MDLQPIPFTAIVEYSRIYEVGDLQEFLEIIRLMDDTFLVLHAEAAKKEKPAGAAASGGNNNKNIKSSR
jgi:hypothetical protein